MLEPDEYLHERIQSVMLEVMGVLYGNNITLVHMGAMMRLLGVPDAKAAQHDNEMLELDEKVGAMRMELNKITPKDFALLVQDLKTISGLYEITEKDKILSKYIHIQQQEQPQEQQEANIKTFCDKIIK